MHNAGPGSLNKLRAIVFSIAVPIGFHASAQELPETGSEFKDCPKCPAMVVVPAGKFTMGSPPTELGRAYDEGIVRTVTIVKPFAVGKFEITFDDWDECVREKQCVAVADPGWGRGRRPVINVSWVQAVRYTKWLSQKTGKKYRLLTEAEWEYTARAGAEASPLFGIAPDRVCEYANLYDITAKEKHDLGWGNLPCDDGYVESAPVGSFKPNGFGLHDMLGNVWEWTEDCLNSSWFGAPVDGSAWERGDCTQRAYRGGSWIDHEPRYLRSIHRYRFFGARYNDLGFRVARE